jgi:hypothetical protein
MYADMGVTGDKAIPLDKLAVVNPSLFDQLRGAAEINISAAFGGRNMGRRLGPAHAGGAIPMAGGEAHLDPPEGRSASPPFVRLSLRATSGLGPAPGSAARMGHPDQPPATVNAYVCETPVTVDLNRAHALATRLSTFAAATAAAVAADTETRITSPITITNEPQAVEMTTAATSITTTASSTSSSASINDEAALQNASVGLKKASKTLGDRLSALLDSVKVPPNLPQILFGKLDGSVFWVSVDNRERIKDNRKRLFP